MKNCDYNYGFAKETKDGRPIIVYDLDEKPTQKPSPLKDLHVWAAFVLCLVVLYVLIFHFPNFARIVFFIVAPFLGIWIILKAIINRLF